MCIIHPYIVCINVNIPCSNIILMYLLYYNDAIQPAALHTLYVLFFFEQKHESTVSKYKCIE